MGNSKKLDLAIYELVEIAKALNENTIANRSRTQEEKINTDTFIKQFGINRKDFAATIKDTNIKYNRATFQYAFGTDEDYNEIQSNDKVIPNESKEIQQEFLSNAKSIPKGTNTEIVIKKEVLQVIKQAINTEYPELVEMIEQYKKSQEHKNIIEIPQINLDNKKLQGTVISKSFKSYEVVFDDFVDFCKGRKETQKDLIALALVEFISKYK